MRRDLQRSCDADKVEGERFKRDSNTFSLVQWIEVYQQACFALASLDCGRDPQGLVNLSLRLTTLI